MFLSYWKKTTETVNKSSQNDSIMDVCWGGSRTAATSKMEYFVIIVNGWKPLTIITKSSISNVAAALDPPLVWYGPKYAFEQKKYLN